MSAARDEADTGPEISTNEFESDPESGQGEDEEQLDLGSGAQRRTGISPKDQTGTSSAIAEAVEFDDYVEPDEPTNLGTTGGPGITETPSSADGSLSIPDDTPSLQVNVPKLLAPRWQC